LTQEQKDFIMLVMLSYFTQNKAIIFAAVGLFVTSMTGLLFFLSQDPGTNAELKTNVMDSISLKSDQEAENNYREILNNKEDPVLVIGIDGIINFMSWSAENATGYSKDDIKNQLFFNYLNPEDLGTFMAAFGKALKDEKPVTMVGPYRVRGKDGAYHYHMGAIYPIIENGKIIKMGIVSRDISQEIKKNEHGNDESMKAQSGDESQFNTEANDKRQNTNPEKQERAESANNENGNDSVRNNQSSEADSNAARDKNANGSQKPTFDQNSVPGHDSEIENKIKSAQPAQPAQPATPAIPAIPADHSGKSVIPAIPATPASPAKPAEPAEPASAPAQPAQKAEPAKPAQASSSAQPAQPSRPSPPPPARPSQPPSRPSKTA
jgi:PAS domain S-box-containing protein